jgi:hypothetical protein
MRIGFNPQPTNRRPVFSTHGEKLGYIENERIMRALDGRLVGRIIRYKQNRDPYATVSACAGTVVGSPEKIPFES